VATSAGWMTRSVAVMAMERTFLGWEDDCEGMGMS
jgi:hypothetical protein